MQVNILQAKNDVLNKKYEDLRIEMKRLRQKNYYLEMRAENKYSGSRRNKSCEVCLKRPRDLYQHLCMDETEIKCEYCTEVFKSTIELGIHLHNAKHTPMKVYKCDKCTLVFRTELFLKFHQMSAEIHRSDDDELSRNTAVFECYLCQMNFQTKTELDVHLKNHVAESKIKQVCSICNKRMTSNELKEHLCGTEDSITCEYCEQSFNVTIDLLQHLESHQEKILHRCQSCRQYFEMERLRDIHKAEIHDNETKSFFCETCGKAFKTNSQLKKHHLSHSEQSKQFLF